MQRVFVQRVAVGDFTDVTQVHHDDAVADVPDHGQVMGDKQVGQLESLLKLFEQVDDLRLNRNVQRGDGLVADNEGRVGRQRSGNADALPLAAGELMRVAAGKVGMQPHDGKQLINPVLVFLTLGQTVNLQGLANNAAAGHAGVQGTVWVLEDDLNPLADPS
ncbi:MAG: hypothetical protein JW395_0682 [Nitrospira sp.]|nr:hypothetical protein [Nitrospira sp.]